MKRSYFTILNVLLAVALLSYFAYDFVTSKKVKARDQINLGMTMSQTEESCLYQLDSLKQLNDKIQFSYDSLLLVCDPVKEEVVVPKKKKTITKKAKVDTITVMDTLLVNNLKTQLASCNDVKNSLTDALIAMDSINKSLRKENELLMAPRISSLINDDVAINTAAYVDSTLYDVEVFPYVSSSLVRIKRPFLSITPRKFVLTAQEHNKYALSAKPVVKELTRKQIPKVKGNHRIKVK